ICREVAQAHGGSIAATPRPGGGTVFVVKLPLIAAAAAMMVTACAHARTFDRSLRAGRWQEAAAEFRADSALQRNAKAVRLAARIHAVPDSATWDPDRALELFARARTLAPKAHEKASDARVESELEYIVRERAARGAEMIVLRDSVAAVGKEVTQLNSELADLRLTNTTYESERAVLQHLAARLESDLHDREAQLAELRSELDRLKAIDLARSSRPRR
ncbi:MAG TPA: hypothetical protein VGI97_10270, partial [Gemmatimonadaceae bacterium]